MHFGVLDCLVASLPAMTRVAETGQWRADLSRRR
jgi:hypothetical protein